MNTLDKLHKVIIERKDGESDKSYVAQLFAAGDSKITKKVAEEAAETIIATLTEPKERIISESADLLFHLSVLWAYKDVDPAEVMQELENRMGVSGLDEKAARQAKEKAL